MKKIVIAAVIVLAVCFVTFFAAGAFGERDTVIRYDNLATITLKNYDEYSEILDAETVSRSENLNAPFDIESKLAEKKFKKELKNLLQVTENPSSALYGESGCYISARGAAVFDVAANKVTESMQGFIFTKDLEEAGTVYLHKESASVSGGGSALLKKLSAERDKRFVVLSNGMDTKLLDGENGVTNVGAAGRHKLEISGDCFGALSGLSVSYDDIVKEENLIWFDFGEMK